MEDSGAQTFTQMNLYRVVFVLTEDEFKGSYFWGGGVGWGGEGFFVNFNKYTFV